METSSGSVKWDIMDYINHEAFSVQKRITEFRNQTIGQLVNGGHNYTVGEIVDTNKGLELQLKRIGYCTNPAVEFSYQTRAVEVDGVPEYYAIGFYCDDNGNEIRKVAKSMGKAEPWDKIGGIANEELRNMASIEISKLLFAQYKKDYPLLTEQLEQEFSL